MESAVRYLFLLAVLGVVYTSDNNGTLHESITPRSGVPNVVVNVDDPCEAYGGDENDFYIVEENPCVPRYEQVIIKTRQQYQPRKYYRKRPVYKSVLPYPTWAPFKPLPMPPMKPLPTFPMWKPLPVVPLKPFKLAPWPTFKPLPVLPLPKLPSYKFPAMKPLPPLPKYKVPTFAPLKPLPAFKPIAFPPPLPKYQIPTFAPLKPLPAFKPIAFQPPLLKYQIPTFAPLKPLPAFKPIAFPALPKPVKSSSFVPVQQASGYTFWSYPVQVPQRLMISTIDHQNYAMGSAVNRVPLGVSNGYWVPNYALPSVHGSSGLSLVQNAHQHHSQVGTNSYGYWLPYNAVPLVHGSSGFQTVHPPSSQISAPVQPGGQSITKGNIYASNMSFVILGCSGNTDARCPSDLFVQAKQPQPSSATGFNGLEIVETGEASIRQATSLEVTGEESPSLIVVDDVRQETEKGSHLVLPDVASTNGSDVFKSTSFADSEGHSESEGSESMFTVHSDANKSTSALKLQGDQVPGALVNGNSTTASHQ